MKSRRTLWILWFVLVFGLFNIYGSSLQSFRTRFNLPNAGTDTILRKLSALQMLGFFVRDDTDTLRYLAYANAILGRPYSSYYVHSPTAPNTSRRNKDPLDESAFPIIAPQRPLLPWRDFSVEYPPGFVIFALIPALLTQNPNTFHALFCLQMEVLLTLSLFFSVRAMDRIAPGHGTQILRTAFVATASLGFITVRRYDAAISFFLSLSFFALAARRPVGAGIALALGIVSKGIPILFAPLAVLYYATTKQWRELTYSASAAAMVCLTMAAAYLTIASNHWSDAFAYHAARPLEIESTYSALLIALRALDHSAVTGGVFSYGSFNIISPYENVLWPIAEIAPLLATLAISFWAWTQFKRSTDDLNRLIILSKGVCAVIVSFCVLGKVFSPQYLTWLIPCAMIASLQLCFADKFVLIIGLILTQIEYPFILALLRANQLPIYGFFLLVRNCALLIWATRLLFARSNLAAFARAGTQSD